MLTCISGLEAGIKIRPSRKDLDVIGDEFRKRWLDYYAPAPDKPVLWIATLSVYVFVLCDNVDRED